MESTSQTLTDKLLTIKKPSELILTERKVDFVSIVSSKEKSVLSLRTERFTELHNFATMATLNFLNLCFPANTAIAPYVAGDLIDSRPTWQVADFVNLFKFIRQRQDLPELRVYGNQITIPKFMEMVSVYEDFRAQALEQERIKGKDKKLMFSEVDKANGKKAAQFMESLKAKLEAKKLPESMDYPDENIFEKR